MNEIDQSVIRAALWLDTWLRRSPRLFRWLVPSACRENFVAVIDRYRLLNPNEN